MKLRVAKHIPLPHTIKKGATVYTFTPDCEIPDELGNAYLKSNPGVYTVAEGKANPDEWKMKPAFEEHTLMNMVAELSTTDKSRVYEFIVGIQEKKAADKEKAEADANNAKLKEIKAEEAKRTKAEAAAEREKKQANKGNSGDE
jgi:hypothetical protein